MASIQLTETATASLATPSSGKDHLFFESADSALKAKNSSGVTRTVDNTVWTTIHEASGRLANDQAAATLLLSQNGSAMLASAANHASPLYVPTTHLVAADHGTNAKFRVRFQVLPNATAPGTITLTAGLYPITVAGGTDIMVYTAGTVVPSSTAAVVNPTASTAATQVSSSFDPPTDGVFGFGVVTSATQANNGAMSVNCQLQKRNA